MTTYISTNGTVQPLTMAVIREIERTIITDLERKRYENLSEHYKSRYSLKSWINTLMKVTVNSTEHIILWLLLLLVQLLKMKTQQLM